MSSSSESAALQRVHDRLAVISNEELPNVLVKLLPGLLPLSNNDELRNQVLGIVAIVSRRAKSLSIPLPCTALLSKVVRPDMMPFAANIAISLLDISMVNIHVSEREECAIAVLEAIELFRSDFSGQASALLNYTLLLLPEIAKCFNRASISDLTKDRVCSWFLDISLVQAGLRKGAAGSIQPGLSVERVSRLTAKREGWFLPELSNQKLQILHAISPVWMDFKFIAAIVMVAVCDPDSEVAKQALFKLNGLRSSILSPPPLDHPVTSLEDVVIFLLHMCTLGCDHANPANPDILEGFRASWDTGGALLFRIPLREEVRAQILRWVKQEASDCIALARVQRHVLEVSRRVFQSSRGDSGGSLPGSSARPATSRYQNAVMDVMDVLCSSPYSLSSPCDSVAVIAQSCLEALLKQVTSSSGQSGGLAAGDVGSFHEDNNMSVRKHGYSALDKISRAYPQHIVTSSCTVSLVAELLRLMEWEHDANLSKLLAALGSLRLAFQGHRQDHVSGSFTATWDTLLSLISAARIASFPKKRIVALQWARALFGWRACVVDTMLMLAGDLDTGVRQAAAAEFVLLRKCVEGTSSRASDEFVDLADIFTGLLRARDLYDLTTLTADQCTAACANVLREVFRSAYCVLNAVQTDATESGQVPFIGPSKWIGVRFSVFSGSNDMSPSLLALRQTALLSMLNLVSSDGMQIFLSSSHIFDVPALEGPVGAQLSVVDEMVRVTRSCLLLGNEACIDQGRVMLPVLLQWLRGASPSVRRYINQAIALLCMKKETAINATDTTDEAFVSNVWRILHLKATEDNVQSVVGAIGCMTAVVECMACECNAHLSNVENRPSNADEELYTSRENRAVDMARILLERVMTLLSPREEQQDDAETDSSLTCSALEALKALGNRGCFTCSGGSPVAPAEGTGSHLTCRSVFSSKLAAAMGDTPSQWLENFLIKCEAVVHKPFRRADRSKTVRLELTKHEVSEVCSALDTISGICSSNMMPINIFERTWTMLVRSRHLANAESIPLRYHYAECLVRIAIVNNLRGNGSAVTNSGEHTPSPLVCELVDMCERTVAASNSPERERSFSAIMLLVILKQCKDASAGSFSPLVSDSATCPFPADALYRITIVLLLVIRGPMQPSGYDSSISITSGAQQPQEPFAQDVCCAGLCRVYDISLGIDPAGTSEIKDDGGGSRKPLSEKVAGLVISTLCREKKAIQSAGVAVAGESTATSSAGDRARALERALDEGTATGISIPGLGGANGVGSDVLAAAAATAAAELNIYTAGANGNNQSGAEGTNSSDAPAQGQYGVYTKVCKVAKKAGDASLVFAVLSLVRRDPSFGCPGSDTEVMFDHYKGPMATIEKTKTTTLLPMLYQARFDPTAAIRDVMRSLWTILVPYETESALLSSLDSEMLKYLASNLTNPQWRDRESACLALEMFIPQRPWSRIRLSLEQLWESGMRVLDDIRDSTRLAAIGFMKVLSNQVVSACNPDVNSSSLNPTSRNETLTDATGFIIPFLLQKGLLSPSAEGKGFSIGLLLRIVKTTKASLQDHLIELISVLVESMSAMEPQTLQYMQFHTDRLQISNEELESTRLKLSQQSPLQDALDQCLDALQAPACAGMVPEVVRNLAGQTKSGVGLATRVTAVRSLMFIINSDAHAAIPQSTTQKCFRSLISSVVPAPPPSVTLKKEMVASLGALSRICDSMFLTEMVSSLMTINRKSGVDNVDLVVTIAECIHQIISKAGDAMQEEIGMWNEVISCSYIGSFDEHEEAKMTWEKVLSCAIIQSTLGTKEAAIKAVLGDILRSVVYHLYHQSWIMRTQAISVLKDMLLCIPSGLVAPNTAEVMVALLRTLPGQMWRGKDASLRVIAQLLEKCPQCLDAEMSTESLLRVVPVPPVVIGPDGVSRESKRVDDSQTLLVIALSDMTSRASLAENITSRLAAYHKDHQLDLSNTVNPQQSIFPKCSAWRLSWTGIITLLLQESERTDRQYRLAAAASLSALPWNAMKSPAAVLSILPMIGRILQCAGMPTSVTGIVDTSELDSTDKNSSDLSTADAANKPARRTNYDMFGGRYGGDSVPDNRKKGIKRARVGRPDENSTLAIAAADPLLGDGEDASDAEGVVEDTLTVTAPEGDAVTNDAVSTSYQMSASDAAFRVKFLETAAALWPNHNMFSAACQAVEESVTDAKSVPVADVIQMVRRMPEATVDWALLVVRHEVWSVRKAVLLLLQAMVNAAWPLSNAAQAVVLDIISVSLDDNKYSQVRAAAASTLLKLIAEGLGESGNYDILDSDAMKSKLNSMVSRMSLDTNPAVILSYASIQKKWASRGQL